MRNNGYLKVSERRADELSGLFAHHAAKARSGEFCEAPLAACSDTIEILTAVAMRDPGKVDETLDLLLSLADHPYRPVRLALAHAFLAIGYACPDHAADSLAALAAMRDEDQSFEVREKIAHAAGTLGHDHADLAEQAFFLIDHFMADDHPAVRRMAVNRLALIGKTHWRWREPAIEKIEHMKADRNSDVRIAAANRLTELRRRTIDDYISNDKNGNLPPSFLM